MLSDCWSKSVDAAEAKYAEGASILALRIHRQFSDVLIVLIAF